MGKELSYIKMVWGGPCQHITTLLNWMQAFLEGVLYSSHDLYSIGLLAGGK